MNLLTIGSYGRFRTVLLLFLVSSILVFPQQLGVFLRNFGAVKLERVVVSQQSVYFSDIRSILDPGVNDATNYLGQSLRWKPDDGSTLELLALVATVQADWEQALHLSYRIVEQVPSSTMGNLLLGHTYWRLERDAEAIQVWRKAKAAVYLLNRVAFYYRNGKNAEAIRLYDLARQVNPDVTPQIESLADIVWVLYFSGRKDDAKAELQLALSAPHQEDWQQFIARGEMGMYFLRERQWQDAIVFFRLALGAGPRSTPYAVWLGRSYMELGEYDQAEEELWQTVRDAAEGDTRAEAYFLLGNLYASKGQTDESTRAYSGAVEASPDNIEYRMYLARSYTSGGQSKKSFSEWEVILSMRPDDPQIQIWYEQAKQQARP